MKKKTIFIALIPLLLILLALILWTSEEKVNAITAKVDRGEFQVEIFSSGELESENSENITIPEKLKDRNLRIYEITITDLIEEGTIVDSGDYVATLDHKVVEEQIKSAQDEMEKALTGYQDAKIDSNLNLSNQRDQIVNAGLDLEEKKIVMEESVYESPSVQKKAQMDYDKAFRKLGQEEKAYQLKSEQEANKVSRAFINYRQIKDRLEELEELYNSLEIKSTKQGMLTYFKHRFGGVTKVGSKISPWNPVVATIPDMDNLISRTFINEIDISKIKPGLAVKIGIDAFPEKQLKGEVISMANVGQNMPNSDAKVFEVKIKIFGKDPDLRPAMTTSNVIFSATYSDTLFIPQEAVHTNDSLQYVFRKNKNKLVRQIVSLGDANENFILVQDGLNEGDELYLSKPDVREDEVPYAGLEIYHAILLEKQKQEEEIAKAREEFKNRTKEPRLPPGVTPEMMKKMQSAKTSNPKSS